MGQLIYNQSKTETLFSSVTFLKKSIQQNPDGNNIYFLTPKNLNFSNFLAITQFSDFLQFYKTTELRNILIKEFQVKEEIGATHTILHFEVFFVVFDVRSSSSVENFNGISFVIKCIDILVFVRFNFFLHDNKCFIICDCVWIKSAVFFDASKYRSSLDVWTKSSY